MRAVGRAAGTDAGRRPATLTAGRPGAVEMDLAGLERHLAGRTARADAPSRARRYVVRQGDTLTGIARRLLGEGSGEGVRRIFEANRDKLHSPDRLAVGVELVIPG